MFIFIWENPCKSEAFTDNEYAWEYFTELKFNMFPDYIHEILTESKDWNGRPKVKTWTWMEFVQRNTKQDIVLSDDSMISKSLYTA